MNLFESIVLKSIHKKLAYIYASPEEAFLAFASSAYTISELQLGVEIDYARQVIINKKCKYEEHFLSNNCFIDSSETFFRCLAYSDMCSNASEKYDTINQKVFSVAEALRAPTSSAGVRTTQGLPNLFARKFL